MEKPIRVNRIVMTTGQQAKAIEEPTRTKILKILYKNQFTAEQILDEMKKTGYNKALTTIRHHIDILKISGLIEVVKIQESRGAIAKFYGTSTKLLEFDTPDDFETKYENLIKSTSEKITKLVKNISQKTNLKTKNQKTMESESYNQYILMEIINRALTNVLENPQTK